MELSVMMTDFLFQKPATLLVKRISSQEFVATMGTKLAAHPLAFLSGVL
jgi:hypothetical protein